MSLLQHGNVTVTVFPETTAKDGDGNVITRPSETGIDCRATIQPHTTASGSTEKQLIGFQTSSSYRMRLVGYPGVLGPRSQIEWNGQRWSIDGPPLLFTSSRRTAHVGYTITRK